MVVTIKERKPSRIIKIKYSFYLIVLSKVITEYTFDILKMKDINLSNNTILIYRILFAGLSWFTIITGAV